jgi:hypothetical protein
MNATTKKQATRKASTTTKVTDATKLTGYEKRMIRLGELKAKEENEGLNLSEIKSLLNTLMLLEDKSPSKIYNNLTKAKGEIADKVKLALGKSPMPTYVQFLEEMTKKNKPLYANWDGICVLAKFNKLAQTATKVEKQNKKVSAI